MAAARSGNRTDGAGARLVRAGGRTDRPRRIRWVSAPETNATEFPNNNEKTPGVPFAGCLLRRSSDRHRNHVMESTTCGGHTHFKKIKVISRLNNFVDI